MSNLPHTQDSPAEKLPSDAGRATLVHPASRREAGLEASSLSRAPDPARRLVNRSLATLGLALFAPAIVILLAGPTLVSGWRSVHAENASLRGGIAIGLSTAALLCSIGFWIIWGTMRPTPRALFLGWAGLTHLPAVPFGFQHTPEDPFGFSPDSFRGLKSPARN